MTQYQNKPAWCGPASLQNALRAYGKRLSQLSLSVACNTSLSEGTDEIGLMAGVPAGFALVPFGTNRQKEAWDWLYKSTPALICVDNWQHWVCVGGICPNTRRAWVFDSTNERQNKAENGSHCLARSTVLRRWRASRRMAEKDPKWYGLQLVKVKV